MTVVWIFGTCMILVTLAYCSLVLRAFSGLIFPREFPEYPVSIDPFFSVILPVRNEEQTILRCLESMINQDFPASDFEIIITDDFSEDKTLELVRSFIINWPAHRWLVLEAGKGTRTGKKYAITRAIEQATGSFIITTDADTSRTQQWLAAFHKCYLRTGAKMILGPVTFTGEKNPFQVFQILEFLGIMGMTAGTANRGIPMMGNGANLGYEKEAFIQVEGFRGNERYISGDDQFLLGKLKRVFGKNSIRFLSDPRAIVTVPAELNLRSFIYQRFRWISKSRGYHDAMVIYTGITTYLFQGMIMAGFLLGFLSPVFLFLSSFMFLVKLLVDLPLVVVMARFFGKQHLLPWYIPAQTFQVLYVTIALPLAFLVPVKWKGRTF